MRIWTSCYQNHWLSPFTILKTVCFWEKDDDVFYNHNNTPNHKYDAWIQRLNPICGALQKVLDLVHPKISYVKIDYWDTWNMDSTLSKIILPMLQQLNKDKHGAPFVDDQDVPEHLRSTSAPPKKEEWDTDDHHFARWDWVMQEMIWAFEQKNQDWEQQFYSGEPDFDWVPSTALDDKGKPITYEMIKGAKNTFVIDHEGMTVHRARMKNGFSLMGKYFEALWD